MATLTNLEIGSVVVTLVENVPSVISGLTATLVNNNVYLAENITGNDIPITAIGEVYQPGIISLTIANVLGLMDSQGIGTKSVKIGELTINKGMNETSSKEWKQLGLEQIKSIGEKVSYYQSWN